MHFRFKAYPEPSLVSVLSDFPYQIAPLLCTVCRWEYLRLKLPVSPQEQRTSLIYQNSHSKETQESLLGVSCGVGSVLWTALTSTGFTSHPDFQMFGSIGCLFGVCLGCSSEKEALQVLFTFVLCYMCVISWGGQGQAQANCVM